MVFICSAIIAGQDWGGRSLRRGQLGIQTPCPLFFWVPRGTYIQGSRLLLKPEQLSLKEAHTVSKLGCQVGLWIPWFLAASGWARPGPKPQTTSIKGQSITRAGLQPRPTPAPGGQWRGWYSSKKKKKNQSSSQVTESEAWCQGERWPWRR